MSALVSPQYVVIHTAGTPGAALDISAESIRDYHVNVKKWADIGYHHVVRMTGKVEAGRPEFRQGAHVEGFNHLSVGVCFSGNGDLADFTPQQKAAGAELVADILERFGLVDDFQRNPMRVLGHCETPQLVPSVFRGPKTTKTCPGRKVYCREFRRLVMAHLRGKS